MKILSGIILFFYLLLPAVVFAQTEVSLTQQEVIYGRKDGMALTMVVLTPKEKAKGTAIISVVSGGWVSTHDWIAGTIGRSQPYLQRGYTVFAVMHGSQPKYTVVEATSDIGRAVRFIRYHAREFSIDPDHIGITGGSAGGHLSLIIATADDKIDITAKDSIDRVSCRVQAVACFYPPTDLLNWSKPGEALVKDKSRLAKAKVRAAFEFTEWNEQMGMLVPITDINQQLKISKQYSPLYHVTEDDPPTIIAHGDKDSAVPLQQSQKIIEKLHQLQIPNKLVVRKGADHGWQDEHVEVEQFADWFDHYLK